MSRVRLQTFEETISTSIYTQARDHNREEQIFHGFGMSAVTFLLVKDVRIEKDRHHSALEIGQRLNKTSMGID